jgi:hypothetical protein
MPSVTLLTVVMLGIIILIVDFQSAIMPECHSAECANVLMLSAVTLSVLILTVNMLGIAMPKVSKLGDNCCAVILLSVIMLKVVAPF